MTQPASKRLLTEAAAAAQASNSATPFGAALSATYAPGSGASVKSYGALGNGIADDTAAINAAITANAGRTVFIPKGTGPYMINATATIGAVSQPIGINLNVPGTTLILAPGAVLKAITNNATNYAVVQVTAADCRIEGGTIQGDRTTHTGTTGEWGHCLDVSTGAHRLIVKDTIVRDAWGDGIHVLGQVQDVSFENVIADMNRRQGLSIIDAIRPRIIGGSYMNTVGGPGTVGLGCGILLEPDFGTTRLVTGAIVSGVTVSGNFGPGLATSANGRPLSATVSGVRAESNGGVDVNTPGFRIYGDTNKTVLTGCHSHKNGGDGFFIEDDCIGVTMTACTATENGRNGFMDTGTRTLWSACAAVKNTSAGFFGFTNSTNLTISNCVAHSNTTPGKDIQIDIQGPGATLTAVHSAAGSATPNYGFVIRSTATGAKLHSCSASGTFASGAYLNQADAIAIPTPGLVDLVIPGKVTGRNTNSGAYVLSAGIPGQAQDRFMVLANGTISQSNGVDAPDVSILRHGSKVAGTAADGSWRTGVAVTASRPSAATVGKGSQFYDSTLEKPIWSDGTIWRDALVARELNTTGLTSAQIDALFSVTPPNGQLASDPTNGLLLVRQAGKWTKTAALTVIA